VEVPTGAPETDVGPLQLSVTAFPISIPADGASTLQVEAMVHDAKGAVVPDGTLVTFSCTGGTIGREQLTQNGRAITNLRSTTTPGGVRVTVTCGPAQQDVTVYFAEEAQYLAAERTIQFVPADGITASTIIARAGGEKSVVPDGTVVTFATDWGEIVGQATTLGGQAVALLTSRSPGEAHIKVRCGSASADVPAVTFVAAKPFRLGLGAASWFLRADGKSQTRLAARLYDPNGQPIYLDGIAVDFEATAGRLSAPRSLTRLGEASTFLTAPVEPGEAVVTARAAELEATLTLTFTDKPSRIAVVPLLPAVASPDGGLRCRIVASVQDKNGHPMPPNTEVSFHTNRGEITPRAKTGQQGTAIAELSFPARVGEALVTAVCEDVEETASIRFSGGEGEVIEEQTNEDQIKQPAKVRLLPLGTAISEGRTVQRVRAVVEDAAGERLPRRSVQFQTTVGEIAQQAETNEFGFADVVLICPPERGEALVTAMVGAVRTSLTVPFTGTEVRSIHFERLPGIIKADGQSVALLRIFLRDEAGEGILIPEGFDLKVEADQGILQPWSVTGPWASYFLRSTQSLGRAEVTASCQGISGSTEFIFAGEPASVALERYPLGGLPGVLYLQATVRDPQGQPVADGTPVTLTLLPSGEPIQTTTQSGRAIIRLDKRSADLTEVLAVCGQAEGRMALGD